MIAPIDYPSTNAPTDRWEDDGGRPLASVTSPDALQLALERYGIVTESLTVFHWGGYRYSNSRDAIAAAKRAAKSD